MKEVAINFNEENLVETKCGDLVIENLKIPFSSFRRKYKFKDDNSFTTYEYEFEFNKKTILETNSDILFLIESNYYDLDNETNVSIIEKNYGKVTSIESSGGKEYITIEAKTPEYYKLVKTEEELLQDEVKDLKRKLETRDRLIKTLEEDIEHLHSNIDELNNSKSKFVMELNEQVDSLRKILLT